MKTKTADEILAYASDYELEELHDRMSDPIIQPRDAIEAINQAIAQRDAEIEEYLMGNTTPCDMMPSNPRDLHFRREYDTALFDIQQFLKTK